MRGESPACAASWLQEGNDDYLQAKLTMADSAQCRGKTWPPFSAAPHAGVPVMLSSSKGSMPAAAAASRFDCALPLLAWPPLQDCAWWSRARLARSSAPSPRPACEGWGKEQLKAS